MGILFAGSPAQAATYYWTTSASTVQAGSGTWSTTVADWCNSTAGGGKFDWTAGSDADFWANGTSAITVSGSQSVGNITFDGTGYTLAGGTLALAGGAITANQNATIGAVLAGSAGLTKLGAGTLILTGSNVYTGGTTIDAGALQIGDGATNSGSLPGNVVISSTTPGALIFSLPASASLAVNGNISGSGSNSGGLTVGGGAVTLNGNLSFAGSLVVNSGTLTLAGTNRYGNIHYDGSGDHTAGNATVLNGGVLSVSSVAANLPQVPGNWPYQDNVLLQLTAGTLLYTGTSASDSTILSTRVGNAAIDVVNAGAGVAFLWAVQGGNLYKTGAGTLTLGGQGDDAGLVAYVQQGTLILAKESFGSGHAVSSIGGVSPGATLQLGAPLDGNGGGGQIYANLNNMNGTFDLHGWSEGLVGLTGTGTVTNSAANAASVLTYGYAVNGCGNPGDTSSYTSTFAGSIVDGLGTMALSLSTDATGALALTLTGTGNAYSGGTTISSGQLTIGNGSTSPGSLPGNVVISSTTLGALTFNTPAAMRVAASGNISGNGSGGLTKSGAGIAILSGNNSYTGPTTIAGGTLQFSNAAGETLSSAISGSGALVMTGPGALTLSGSNTYAGGTTIDGGLLAFSGTGAVPPGTGNIAINSGGALAVAGAYGTIDGWIGSNKIAANSAGVLALGGTDAESVSMGSLASLGIGAAGTATFAGSLAPAGATYRLGGAGGVLTFSTALTGGNSLVAFGGGSGGTLILTGSNSYTGPTTIGSGGTLEFSSAVKQTLSGNISGGGALVTTGPGALILAGSNSYTGPTIIAGGTLEFSGAANETLSGNISGSGALVAMGPGTLTLAGSNSYTGGTTIAGGTLQFGSAASETFSGNITGSGALATLGAGTLTLAGSNSYTGGTTIGGGTLQFSSAANQTLSGNISGGGALATTGPGALTLSGSNSYAGGTTIGGGVLALSNTGAIPPGTGNIAISSGGALAVSGAYGTIGGWVGSNKIAAGSAGVLALSGTDAETVGMGSLTSLVIGTTGTATFSGSLAPAGSTYRLGGGGGVLTFSTALTGGNSLVAFGGGSGGTLILSGSNSYTGGTTIDGGGVLAFSGTGAVPQTGNIAINSAAVLTGGYSTIGGWLNKIAASSAGVLALGGTDAETVNMGSVASLVIGTTGTATFSGGFAPAGGVYRLGGGGGVLTFATALTGGNSLAAFGGGSGGTLILSGSNSYAGATTIGSGGTLEFSSAANQTLNGDISGSGALIQAGAGALTLTGSNTYSGATAVNAGTLQIGNGGATGTVAGAIADNATLVFNRADSPSYSGAISGSGSLVQAGAGTLTLTGSNTYGGATTIKAGALQIGDGQSSPGSLPGNVVISSTTPGALIFDLPAGASLTANGNISGSATNSGGLIVVGGAVTLNGNLSFAGGVTVTAGTLTLGGSNTYGNVVPPFNGWDNFTGATTLLGGVLSVSSVRNNLPDPYSGLGVYEHTLLYLTGGTLLYTGTGTSDNTNACVSVGTWISGVGYNGTINVANSAANFTFNSAVSSAGGDLIKAGPGTLTLGGQGDNAGLVVDVQQGALVLAKAGSGTAGHAVSSIGGVSPGATLLLGNASDGSGGGCQIYANLYNMNGTADFNGWSEGIYQLTGTGLVTNNKAASTAVMTIGWVNNGPQSGANSTFAGVLANGAGAMALSVSGGAVFTLTGTGNAYSGGTTIGAGQLNVGDGATSPGSLPGNVVINSTTPGALTFNTPAGMSVAASGNISGSGTGGLTKNGAGLAVLSGANSYTGQTIVGAGTLAVNGSLYGGGQVVVGTVGNGGALGGAGGVGNVVVQAGGALSPGYAAGAGTLTAASVYLGANTTLNYTLGAAASNSGFLKVVGALTLPASGGTLNIANGGSLGVGTYPLIGYGALNVGSGGFSAFSAVNLPQSLIAAGDGCCLTNDATDKLIDLVISAQTNGVWVVGSGGTWSTASNWSGGSAPGGGPVDTAVFGPALSGGTATVALTGSRSLSSLAFSTTGAGASYVISGTSPLALYNGINWATLSDSGGNHTIAAPIALGGNLSVTAAPGSTLTVGGAISETNTGTTLNLSGGGTLVLAGSNSYTGGTTVNAGTLQIGNGGNGAAMSGSGGIAMSNNAAVTFSLAGTLAYSGPISGSGQLATTGSGLLALSGSNTYSGATTISAGTLQVAGNDNCLPTATALTIASGGALDLDGNSQTVGSLSGSAGAVVANSGAGSGNATLTVAPASGATTFAGNIVGNTTLVLSGSGELTLTGTDTYTGGTTINGGTLDIAAGSAFSASSSSASVTIIAGGGGELVLGSGGSGSGSPQLVFGGSGSGIGGLLRASLSATGEVVLSPAATPATATIAGYESASASTATLGGDSPLSPGGAGGAVGGTGAAAPEPGALALLAAGALSLAAFAWRRRKAT